MVFPEEVKYQKNLELILDCDRNGQTICQHQYTTYPLRLSTSFRLEGVASKRIYHYLINTSPGLLAGDQLDLSLKLTPNTSLYFTDQAATKVHPMPQKKTKATINYQITVDANASLELVPEPLILYTDSILEQNTLIKLHPTARLFITEIILPGRLAKNEYYDFNYYWNRLQVSDLENNLLFTDATLLRGQHNQFKHHQLFSSLPIIGNAIAVLPDLDLDLVIKQLDNLSLAGLDKISVANSILPDQQGILIRALSNKTNNLKQYFNSVINCIRLLNKQSCLPHIAK